MFIPASFRVDDLEELHNFIDTYGFGTLISDHDGIPFGSHLPLLLDREQNLLLGHMARANPHWEAFATTESLAIFHGPHAYISPTWYVNSPAVPTWNYAAVHVYGVAQILSEEQTRSVVERTVQKYEGSRSTPWTYDIPAEFRDKLLRGIVGFSIPLTRIEGKYKLGQNRPVADQERMFANLQQGGVDEQLLAAFIVQKQTKAQPT
jgi:transcriptional regulator